MTIRPPVPQSRVRYRFLYDNSLLSVTATADGVSVRHKIIKCTSERPQQYQVPTARYRLQHLLSVIDDIWTRLLRSSKISNLKGKWG
jgi:hypothetical protein